MAKTKKALIALPDERIIRQIFLIRGQKVMLDHDLAKLYGVTTGNLNKAVKRNIERFPDSFMLQLTQKEYESLRFQIGILKRGRHSKYLPYAFTEQGVAMLSSVLNSKRAIQVNIQIIKTFVKLREMLTSYKSLRDKIEGMEKRYDKRFKIVFTAIKRLMADEEKPKRVIGFKTK